MSTAHTPTRVSRIIAFADNGYYRLYDTWADAAQALNMKKHEFYFKLNNGTPIATPEGDIFIDIYISQAERRHIAEAERIRRRWNTNNASHDLTPC